MSRSYRHTPICGVTTARSEKEDKQIEHRKWRAAVHEALAHEDWFRASFNVPTSGWFDKDGKQYFGIPYYHQSYWSNPREIQMVDDWKMWRK